MPLLLSSNFATCSTRFHPKRRSQLVKQVAAENALLIALHAKPIATCRPVTCSSLISPPRRLRGRRRDSAWKQMLSLVQTLLCYPASQDEPWLQNIHGGGQIQ